MISNQAFWGKKLKTHEYKYYVLNKKLIFINFMSLFIPDFIFFIRHLFKLSKKTSNQNINYIPTISSVTIHPIPRIIHVLLWYYGYFYRMKILNRGNGYYKYFYYGQLITWLFINLFPETREGGTVIDNIHYTSACVNFNLFAIMKIFYCKDSLSFVILFINLIDGFIRKKHSKFGILERLCMYHVIMTRPIKMN
jgi:hypothetical protein